jgi:hypothetical protein
MSTLGQLQETPAHNLEQERPIFPTKSFLEDEPFLLSFITGVFGNVLLSFLTGKIVF